MRFITPEITEEIKKLSADGYKNIFDYKSQKNGIKHEIRAKLSNFVKGLKVIFGIKIEENEINKKTICLNEIKNDLISQKKIIESIINQLELSRGISVNSKKISELEMKSLMKLV